MHAPGSQSGMLLSGTRVRRIALALDAHVRLRLTAVCALLMALLACAAHAGTILQEDLSGYTRRIWQTTDGLPEQTVQAFAQTPDGYLWIGTTGGLLRFDGARFVTFDRQNTPGLIDNNIFCLTVTRDGALWIGTEGGGLARYYGGTFRTWTTREGLSNDFVRTIVEDARGTIWAGTDNGLLRLKGSRFERVDGAGGVPALAVHALLAEANGNLWAGGSRLLLLRPDGSSQEFTMPGEASQNRVKSLLRTHDGTLWVGTVAGLSRMTAASSAIVRVSGVSSTVRVLRAVEGSGLWIGTIGQGAFILRGDTLRHVNMPGALPSNTILNLFEDDERNLWIGTQAGMARLTHTPVTILPLPQASDSDFGTIYEDRDRSLWIASTRLFHLTANALEPATLPGIGRAHVRNVLRDRSGALWVGTDGDGVYRLSAAGATHYTTREGLSNNFVRAMAQDVDGSMWIALDEGVSHIVGTGAAARIVSYGMREGLAYFSTRVLLVDHSGDVWIGTDGGLSHLHAGHFVTDAATSALARSKVWAIYQDATGSLWFGTRTSGLFQLKDDRLIRFTSNDGLPSNAVYQILGDNAGHLWLSSPNGISYLDRSDLGAQAQLTSRHLKVTFYPVGEISGAVEIYGGTQCSGAITPEGEVWFPTNRGPLHIAGLPALRTAAPRLHVDPVLVDGSPAPAGGVLRLAAGTSRIAFHYAPVLLRSQGAIRFQFMLEGFDRDWSPPTTARSAEYTNLPPGEYRFRIRTFEIDRPAAYSEATVELVQLPHLYRTWWFITIVVAVIALAIYLIYRARVRQVRARFAAVLEERSRLAREMHDTVIQGCTSVSALLEAVAMEQESGQSGTALMDFARVQIRTTIDEARDAIWNMRQADEDPNALGARVQAMTQQIAAEFGAEITCASRGVAFAVVQPLAHDVLMVSREAVLNAIHHGKPRHTDIQLTYTRSELEIAVTDDGCGFDLNANTAQNSHHFGLKGMRERILRWGGTFTVDARMGKGVRIEARVPRVRSGNGAP